jgi:AraC-like DNA-binding protein
MLRIRSASPSRLEASGEWNVTFRGCQHIKVAAVVSGSCWVTADDGVPLRMDAGDCYMLSAGIPYRIASNLEAPLLDGNDLFTCATSSTVLLGDRPDDANRTVLIGGMVIFDETTAALLLDSLPPVTRIGASTHPAHVLHPTLQLLADETAVALPGRTAMSEHLTEILFLQVLRSHLADHEGDDRQSLGWLGALNDPQIGAALALMHREPGRRWTVAALATSAAMSRSAFALRFKTLVGLSPLDYLLQWRIRAAEQALKVTHRSVASIAAEWGYESESAFSNAFKRVTGHRPTHYRGTVGS